MNIKKKKKSFRNDQKSPIETLQDTKCVKYSCVFVVINRTKQQKKDEFPENTPIFKALKKNQSLRYKSKFILCLYRIDGPNRSADVVFNSFAEYVGYETVMNNIFYPKNVKRGKYKQFREDHNRSLAATDFKEFISFRIPNAVLMQCFIHNKRYDGISKEILGKINPDEEISVQEFLSDKYFDKYTERRVAQSTTTEGLYFYAINPALAIIINNYYFTGPHHTTRKGSERDVAHLVRMLKLRSIPYIIVEDCNKDQMLQILEYLKQKDFAPLQSLMFYVMSHGNKNNVIYTKDDQVDLNTDIINSIQANPSLKNVDKLVVANACRGADDLDYVDYEQPDAETLEEIRLILSPNTVVLCSVPYGVQSVRRADMGSALIQSMCFKLPEIEPTSDIRQLDEELNNDLKQISTYEELEKVTDLLLADPDKHQGVMKMPVAAVKIMRLMESLQDDFPVQEKGKVCMVSRFLHVCHALNKSKEQWGQFAGTYYGGYLEENECGLETPIDWSKY